MKQIPLTQGFFTIIDDDMLDRISYFNWGAKKIKNNIYANARIYGNKKTISIQMHQLILGFNFLKIDHKNGNGLDNRKENLRPATTSQNAMNSKKRNSTTSNYKGVFYDKYRRKYVASICVNKKRIRLLVSESEIECATAYNIAAIKHFNDFARINIILQKKQKTQKCIYKKTKIMAAIELAEQNGYTHIAAQQRTNTSFYLIIPTYIIIKHGAWISHGSKEIFIKSGEIFLLNHVPEYAIQRKTAISHFESLQR